MLDNPQVSRTPSILIECTSSQKPCTSLKQAPRTWYARLKTFLLDHGFVMGSVDKFLFTLKHGNNLLPVQI
jgi:hypothetical protein